LKLNQSTQYAIDSPRTFGHGIYNLFYGKIVASEVSSMFAPQSSPRMGAPFACLAVAVALVSCSKNKEAQDVGGVLTVHGNWRIAGQQRSLLEGEAVPAGALLEDVKIQKGDSITVVLLSGGRVEAMCDRDSDLCTKGLRMPGMYVNSSLESRQIVQAVKAVLLDHEPEVARSFSPTMSRGRSSAQDRELVVAFNPGTPADIGSALADLPAYDSSIDEIEITRVADSRGVISTSPVSWDERRVASITLPGPGCYIVQVVRDDDEVALNLYVLAVPAASYERTNALFEEARQICSKWDGPNAEGSTHKFLRAYLLSLANK
jgi:hypothetical protein